VTDEVRSGFRLLAGARHAPALHPHGLTCAGELEIVDDGRGPWGVPFLDTPGRHAATVRLSRAAGLPRGLPDGLGLAVRVERADEEGRTLDLLLTGSGRGRFTRRLPLPRIDVLGGPYSSLLAYRVGDRDRLLAALPRPSARRPVPGDPAGLRAALAAGPIVLDLCAGTGRRSWRVFGVLTVRTPLPVPTEQTPGFDVYAHDLPGLTPGEALAGVRRAAYRGSRVGRREAPRE
jgi:hypothetical protein